MRITAAVSRDNQQTPKLEDVDLADPRPGEILVRIVATGICHTDYHANDGYAVPTPKPAVLGHEGAGIVEKVGDGVFHVQPGDHVVMSGSSCGVCPSCMSAKPTYCVEAMPRSFGAQRRDGTTALSQNGAPIHSHFFGQSSFATYAVADARGAVRVPKDVPLDIVAPMACGVITGAGSVFYALKVKPGESIAIFGCGGVGLSAIMAARLSGAKHIVAIDPLPDRRKLALELGATDVLDAGSDNVAGALREISRHGFEHILNTTTASAVFDAAVKSLSLEGTFGFVSIPREPWTPDLRTIFAGGRKLRGIIGGDANPQTAIPMMIDYWKQGRFPIEKMIRHYDFDHFTEAWESSREWSTIKPVLRMA